MPMMSADWTSIFSPVLLTALVDFLAFLCCRGHFGFSPVC